MISFIYTADVHLDARLISLSDKYDETKRFSFNHAHATDSPLRSFPGKIER